jgi:hypothetical protein
VVINGRSQILSPPKPDIYTDPPPFKGIQWTVMNSTGEIFLGTSGGKKLTHFDPQHNPMNAAFPSEEIGKHLDVALDASGRVCLLLESGGTLARFAPDGSRIDQADLKGLIPSLGEVRKMRTDFLGHFYLLDGKKNVLYVLSGDLKLVTQLDLGSLGIGRAGDVALDERGGIYLLDELNACVFRLE